MGGICLLALFSKDRRYSSNDRFKPAVGRPDVDRIQLQQYPRHILAGNERDKSHKHRNQLPFKFSRSQSVLDVRPQRVRLQRAVRDQSDHDIGLIQRLADLLGPIVSRSDFVGGIPHGKPGLGKFNSEPGCQVSVLACVTDKYSHGTIIARRSPLSRRLQKEARFYPAKRGAHGPFILQPTQNCSENKAGKIVTEDRPHQRGGEIGKPWRRMICGQMALALAAPARYDPGNAKRLAIPSAWADRTGTVYCGNDYMMNPGTAGIVDASGRVVAHSQVGAEVVAVGNIQVKASRPAAQTPSKP